jgi:hypothetical protein
MSAPYTAAALAAEFDCLLARAGITLPADRHAAALALYPDLREQIDLLHAVRPAGSEPSNVYRLTPAGTMER